MQRSFDSQTCKLLLLEFLKLINIIEASQEAVLQALKSPFDDIEDAIHYFTALTHEMDYLISSDRKFQRAAMSNLPILGIHEINKRLFY